MKKISRRQLIGFATLAGGTSLFGRSHSASGAEAVGQGHGLFSDGSVKQTIGYAAADGYAEIVRQPVFKMSIAPHWFAANRCFWYVNYGKLGSRDFVLVDTAKGTRLPAFDHARVAAALSTASGKACSASMLPFDAIDVADDLSSVKFVVEQNGWQCDLRSYAVTRISRESVRDQAQRGARNDGENEPHGDTGEDTSGDADVASPDGSLTAFVRDGNLWIRAKVGGPENKLSASGTEAMPFGQVAWAPDSKSLVAFRIDKAVTDPCFMVESSPKDGGFRGVLHQHEYLQPGNKMTSYEMWVFDLAAAQAVSEKVDVDPITYDGVPSIVWRPDNRRFLYEQRDRGHQFFRVVEVSVSTGKTRNIVNDLAKTFINTSNVYTYYTRDANEVLYASEQDGWRHLYLYDAQTAQLKNQVTHGEWVVRRVDRVDEDARQIWFQASGKNPGEDPYLLHYYRVNFDGTGLTEITQGNGTHTVQWSPDRKFVIDTCSRVDLPPVHTLRRTTDGSLVCNLESADISELTSKGWKAPEVFHAKGRDGATDIWGIVCRPLHVDTSKKYPVIENIYAGPQDSFVRKSFAVSDEMQSQAQLGFIVVQCDGMGTRNRSKAFHDVCWHNIADGGFPDRIAWITALSKEYGYVDTARVGIYGTSAGGQSSTGALLFHPEFYKAAVSACGCHDNRIDKQWWNEQWMGYPVGPWYAECSNIDNAHKLRGKLLLIVGELDSNVPPESTIRLTNALMQAGKDFDLLIIPGSDHTSGGDYGERRRRDFFVRHLLGIEPPDRNVPAPPVKPVNLTAKGAHDLSWIYAGGGGGTTITFENHTRHSVKLYWLQDPNSRKLYGTVEAGQSYVQNTYAGHGWLVTDENDNPLMIFVGESRPGIAMISAP